MTALQKKFLNEKCDFCQKFDLLDMINDALVLINSADGTILFMNQKALEFYQYTREDVSKLSLFSISHGSASDVITAMKIAKQYASGHIATSRHVTKYGKIMKVQTNTKEINFHGQKIFATTVRDIAPSEKFREEIETLGKVQRKLLPQNISNAFICTSTFYHPFNYASGDLYDFYFDNTKKVMRGLLIDVMGHGSAAVAQTSLFKYLFQRSIEKSIPLNKRLEWINREVMPFFHEENFAAAILFELDCTAHTLTYSAGGINHFTYLSKQGIADIQCPGMFLGIHSAEQFDAGTIQFQSGDSFFFLTDGFEKCNLQTIHSQPSFREMNNYLKNHTQTVPCHDDASGIGIVIL
jgi:sigma-B regulation protein RsbU (phosphoserine phosphatase)